MVAHSRRQRNVYPRGLSDAAWVVAWILLLALVAYVVLVSVLTSDLENLAHDVAGVNTKGVACGSSPDATVSTLAFFPSHEESFDQTACVTECPVQSDTNLTLCSSTMVSTACPPPCESQIPCQQNQTFNVTGYPAQRVLQFCVPDLATGSDLTQQHFASTAELTFRYETAEAAVALGPWQAMHTLSVTVAAMDCMLLFLCLMLTCCGRSCAATVAVYGSVTATCLLLVMSAVWLQPSKAVWSATDIAWALRLPYVRWLTLLMQGVVSLMACRTILKLISVQESISKTHRALRLLSSVAELLTASPEVWIVPVLACILIQALMVAVMVPVATYVYAHARAAQMPPVAWVPQGHPWAPHAVAGGVLLLFMLLSWWSVGTAVAYCRAISAATVRAHYHSLGTGASLPQRAVLKAASQLLQRHLGSLLAAVVLVPLSWWTKAAFALFVDDSLSMAFLNVTHETALSGPLLGTSSLLEAVEATQRVLQLSIGRVGLAEPMCAPWASACQTFLLWLGISTYLAVQLLVPDTWPSADVHLLPMLLAGCISMTSILPLTAVVEQAASTLVVCFCEETVDHQVNGSVFRRLVLPPQLHSCLNDSLNVTAQYQAHQQQLARQRAEEQAAQAAAQDQAPAALPVLAQAAPQPVEFQRVSSGDVDADATHLDARPSVAFGAVQEMRRSTARSVASGHPVSAMRPTTLLHSQDYAVPGIEY